MLLSLRRPDEPRLRQLVAAQAGARLSYPEVGATLGPELPAGYHHDRHRVVVGRGGRAFQRAVTGLRRWEAHAAAGATVRPVDPPIAIGTDVVLVLRAIAVYVIAACRIVAVVDEPARFGFAYGTLPIHPERGEEAFVVERTADDDVVFHVVAFSRGAIRSRDSARPSTAPSSGGPPRPISKASAASWRS